MNQNWLKIKKILKTRVIFLKFWPKIGPIGIQMGIGIHVYMGHVFLKNWYLYGSNFKFRGSTSLPKPNLSIPPPRVSEISLEDGKLWNRTHDDDDVIWQDFDVGKP